MGTKGNVYGEGNYEASRQYNDATKKFVEAGKVEEQAALLRAKDSPPPLRQPLAPAPVVEDRPRERNGRPAPKSR